MSQTLKVYGPPGTGKTEYLLNTLERELKTVRPDRIAFMTFTRAARLEALERTHMTEAELPFLRTIHSICYRQLGVGQHQMIKPKHLKEFGEGIGVELSGKLPDPWQEDLGYLGYEKPTKADMLLAINHLGRHRMIGLKEMLTFADQDLDLMFAKWFTESYRNWKVSENMFDFTDLLSEFLEAGKPLPVDVMFVDEAQDLSKLQWQVVNKLGKNAERVYLAGDDDQSIFTWAGASAHAFIAERADDQVILEQSRRCPRRVLDLAHSIISNVNERVAKATRPRDCEGEVNTAAYFDSDLVNSSQETFVLFRNHHRGFQIAAELASMSIPYLGSGSVLSKKDVVAAIEAWDLLLHRKPLTVFQAQSFCKYADPMLINSTVVSTSKEYKEKPQLLSNYLNTKVIPLLMPRALPKLPSLTYLNNCLETCGLTTTIKPKVTLMSIHQSKGQEAHTVILDTEMARKTYDGFMANPDDEHRVWYVGVTRTKERLVTILPMNQLHYKF